MAEYSPKEFGELVGMSRSTIEVNVKRYKIVKNEAKKIDSNNPINALFIEKNLQKKEDTPEVKSKVVTNKTTVKKKQETTEDTAKDVTTASAMMQVEYATKKLNAQKIQTEIKIKELDLEKKQGLVIETNFAKELLQLVVSELSNEYRNSSKQFIIKLSATYDIPDIEIAGINKIFDDSINEAVDNAKNNIRKRTREYVQEYSKSRNIGERL